MLGGGRGTEDLADTYRKPLRCEPGPEALTRGFLAVAADDDWQHRQPAPQQALFIQHLRLLHELLSEGGFEFGHRVFYEATRYAAMLAAAGEPDAERALDQQVLQKVLPRLHGNRRRLEGTLCALGRFCLDLTFPSGSVTATVNRFDPEPPPQGQPKLPRSFDKVQRMTRSLRTNQFASFTE